MGSALFVAKERIPCSDLHRGQIFLYKGAYCEVRSARAAGQGRSPLYEVRYRELLTRKAREVKLKESETLEVIDCDRVSMPVLYQDEERLVLADSDYNEVEISSQQVGDATALLTSGDTVSVLYHEDNIVKVIPPPAVAEELRQTFRKQRREELSAKREARREERAQARKGRQTRWWRLKKACCPAGLFHPLPLQVVTGWATCRQQSLQSWGNKKDDITKLLQMQLTTVQASLLDIPGLECA
eukprot:s1172_g2.t2